MLKNKFILIILIFSLFSCQSTEKLTAIVFDYNQFIKIALNADKKNINDLYDPKYSNPYIDHSLINPPGEYLKQWLSENFILFGSNNLFEINIIESSLKKTEVLNNDKKKYTEKTIYLYEMYFLVEFNLFNDDNILLANSLVETKRSTTSNKYISIQENENIIQYLIFNSLKDFSKKTEEFINIHFKNFIL